MFNILVSCPSFLTFLIEYIYIKYTHINAYGNIRFCFYVVFMQIIKTPSFNFIVRRQKPATKTGNKSTTNTETSKGSSVNLRPKPKRYYQHATLSPWSMTQWVGVSESIYLCVFYSFTLCNNIPPTCYTHILLLCEGRTCPIQFSGAKWEQMLIAQPAHYQRLTSPVSFVGVVALA